MVLFAGNNK